MKHLWCVVTAGLFSIGVSAEDAAPVNVHEAMKATIVPQTQSVWDISNKLLADAGSAVQLKPAEWEQVAKAALAGKAASVKLAEAQRFLAAAPHQKIQGEGNPGAFGAKQVQAAIDANPAAFRAFARQLAAVMDEVVVSTRTKDAAKLTDAAGQLDQVCEACHQQFWYPNQGATR